MCHIVVWKDSPDRYSVGMGVLNNVSTKTIKEPITRTGLEGCLTYWILSLLKTRIIISDLVGSYLILAPPLSQDGILVMLGRSGVEMVAYVDDLAILV